MIEYQAGVSLKLLCSCKGSVFPKALAWSVPASLLAGLLNLLLLGEHHDSEDAPALGADFSSASLLGIFLDVEGMHLLWSSYSFVLGFLVVFRNGQAYSRFWEGAELIHQVRGEWINAMSSLIAFCNTDQDKAHEVAKFQHCAVRMMSMLHCAALQQIAEVSDHSFEILDPAGLDPERLSFLSQLHPVERCQVLLQWLQRLIIDADEAKTLKVAPPILSRVYQELSRGIVNLDNVAKIKQVPFPFPYAQMIAAMMIIHWIITPILASQAIKSMFWATFMTFITLTSFWSLFYIANEIEQPFGKDENDLPVSDMQAEMNHSLTLLLRQEVQAAPSFEFCADTHNKLFRSQSHITIPCAGHSDRSNLGRFEKVTRVSLGEARPPAQQAGKIPPKTRIMEGEEPPPEASDVPSQASGGASAADVETPARSREPPESSAGASAAKPEAEEKSREERPEGDSAVEQSRACISPRDNTSRVPAEDEGGRRAFSTGPISSSATKLRSDMAPDRPGKEARFKELSPAQI